MSRQKQLSVVFGVANAQKQGVMGARLDLASSTTMFQELERVVNAECRMQNAECGMQNAECGVQSAEG